MSDLRRTIEVVIKGTDQTGPAAAAAGTSLGGLIGRVAAVGAALGIGATAANAFGNALRGALSQGGEIDRLSRVLGVSTGEIQKLSFASKILDADFNSVITSMLQLQRRTGEMGAEGAAAAKALESIGLSANRIREMAPTEALERIGQALQTLPNQSDRARVAFEIFGRGAQDMIAILAGGPEEFRKLTEEAARVATILPENAAALDRLGDAWERVKAEIGAAMGNLTGFIVRMQEAMGLAASKSGTWLARFFQPEATEAGRIAAMTSNGASALALFGGPIPTTAGSNPFAAGGGAAAALFGAPAGGGGGGGGGASLADLLSRLSALGGIGNLKTRQKYATGKSPDIGLDEWEKALEGVRDATDDVTQSADYAVDAFSELGYQIDLTNRMGEEMGAAFTESMFQFADSVGYAFATALVYQKNFGAQMKAAFRGLIADMIAQLTALIARMAVAATLKFILDPGGSSAAAGQAAAVMSGAASAFTGGGGPGPQLAYAGGGGPVFATGGYGGGAARAITVNVHSVFGGAAERRAIARAVLDAVAGEQEQNP